MANELIGEGLVRIGAMSQMEVDDILKRQKNGDNRRFGVIAVELGYIDMSAIDKYLNELS